MTAEHSYQFTSAAPPYGASYGETFIEQGGYRYDNPYKFNGKELDQETGLYYYGARYYDPKMSMWLSVDPLAGEYPSLSPFAYTYGNPVRFADPTGMAPEDIILKGKNNSSIIIKTDLIDISVNAGAIIGDVGGNYTLEGDEVLIAALDIVGIADPTGAADAISATLEAKRGNWKGAVLSGLGIIPYIGDLGKAAKLPKHLKTLRKAIEAASHSKIIYKFSGNKAIEHFEKHGGSIMKALNKKSYSLKEYLEDANYIINNGQYVPELNGYVKLIGGKGKAKYGFVGMKEGGKEISTFHIKTAEELSKKAPSLNIQY